MDPTELLKACYHAWQANDSSAMRVHANDLAHWLDRRGFAPDLSQLDEAQKRWLVRWALKGLTH